MKNRIFFFTAHHVRWPAQFTTPLGSNNACFLVQTDFPGLSSTAPIHIHRNRVGIPAMEVFPNSNQCAFVSLKGYAGRKRLCSCTSVRTAACPCMRTIDRSSHAGYRSILALTSLAVFSPIVFIRCSFPEKQQHIETGFHQRDPGKYKPCSCLACKIRLPSSFRHTYPPPPSPSCPISLTRGLTA